jgi:hypothetical protein
MDEDNLIRLFCLVDDFCKIFEPELNSIALEHYKPGSRWWTTRKSKLSLSEIMTIAIFFHSSGYRTFKHYYEYFVLEHLKPFFPALVSYRQFNKLLKRLVIPMIVLQKSLAGKMEGIGFVDSTTLSVCHICRASNHKVFRNFAKKGKSTTGWFLGMKLHIVINHKAEIVSWMLTPGNVDDRKPVPNLVKNLFGKIYGDRGYLGKELFDKLYSEGIQLITRLKSNMKNMLMDVFDKLVLYKRGLIESVNNKLKNGCQIDHHRHRSKLNFMTNLVSGLISYSLSSDKPHIEDLNFNNCFG